MRGVKILTIIFLFGSGAIILWISTLQIPDFKGLRERKVSESTKIYDRTGEVLLYDIHQDVTRRVVPYSDISASLRNAVIAIEDTDFYRHNGIKLGSMMRSALVNLGSGTLKQGGSTITQQVIKNALLTSEKRFSRKVKEIVLALKLERVMTKEEILTLYLNEVPYGGSIYGAEDASLRFFGKKAREITLAEAAYLAAIPRAPSFYSPYGNNKIKLDERKNLVLDRMVELGFVKKESGILAKKEVVIFLKRDDGGIKAPHFVEFVKLYLEGKYGRDYLETKGLKIVTTLNWELEQKAEQIVKRNAEENEKKFNAKNAGMIAVDPKTGQVLVMVGSRDYFDKEREGNFNVTIAHRQPGSAFKPFVYATAFNKGYLPETVLFDLPTQFQITCSPDGAPLLETMKKEDCYMPVNYDGKFRGPISLQNALAQSINIPAIKLLYLVGINDSIETARTMGIRGLDDPLRYGLTLVLGGGEVSLLDMTSAYSVFGNDGVRIPYSVILRIEDKNGNIIENYEAEEGATRVLPENTARTINSILSDKEARTPIFGENSILDIPGREIAVKTGTTNDFRDAWVVGYMPNIALGVWAGNNDNSVMEKKVAGYIAAPMWSEFLKEAAKTLPAEKFLRPEKADTNKTVPVLRGLWQGNISFDIDKISGKLATENTPKELRETRVVRQVHSILYWTDNDSPQLVLWETPIQKWAKENGLTDETLDVIPKDEDDIHKPELAPKIKIISPSPEISYPPKKRLVIQIQNGGRFPLSQVDFFINNTRLGSSRGPIFEFNFVPSEVPGVGSVNNIRVTAYDSVMNRSDAETTLNLSI